MDNFIDMHVHILPGVDDGAEDIKEMEEMLKIAYSEGIRCIIATPHHHPRRGKESPEVLRKKAALLRKSAHEIDEHFRIYLGTEIFFGQDVLEKLKEGRILTMNRRNYVLVEFSPSEPFSYIKQSLQQLMNLKTRERVDASQASYLGIRGSDVSYEASEMYGIPTGVVISEVVENGPADQAGVKSGDVLTELDGRSISNMSQLQDVLEYYAAGETVDIDVQRADNGEYQAQTLSITLGSASDAQNQ